MTRHPSSFLLHPCPRRGFTLLEVMISVAIMLFLVIGINQVFSTTSATIGAGQAASALTRDQKAASTVFYSDWQGVATIDSPCIIIHSSALPMFLNKVDEAADGDGNAMTVEQPGVPGGTSVSAFTYNYRNHRVDTFSFFSRGDFPRQTGNNGFPPDMSSNEAWIWYGHLRLPNNLAPTATYYDPGASDVSVADKNDNNRYASQWVLGREAMLLRTPNTSGLIVDNKNNNQQYINFTAGANLTPLAYGSPATSGGFGIQNSRYDLANTSIDKFRSRVIAAITADPANWWSLMAYTATSPVAATPAYRFDCDPYSILNRAGTVTQQSNAYAQMTPYFLPGCTQFMVEYAGDFVTQDANPASATYGEVKTDSGGLPIIQPDGIVDFYIDKSADPGDSTKWVRKTRWFGLGRDLTNNGTAADDGDVRPFRDSWPSSPAIPQQAFEKVITAPSGGSPGVYTCVFGPTDVKPKMIRITVTITDPNDRLANGQTYEYVLGTP